MLRVACSILFDRPNRVSIHIAVGHDLRKTIENLQQQVRSAFGFGVAKDGRSIVKRKPFPAQNRLGGFSSGA
jgi:3-deoxy-D-manno-octulosonic acid (KDO) 8-phosphate synthase